MHRLIVRHLAATGTDSFEVQRVNEAGAKAAPAVVVEDPLKQALPGTEAWLGTELAWYLESYLDYPFGAKVLRAERVQAGLRGWGKRAFEALFGQGQARDFYRDATRDGHTALQLVIASDDPRCCPGRGRRCTTRWWASWHAALPHRAAARPHRRPAAAAREACRASG